MVKIKFISIKIMDFQISKYLYSKNDKKEFYYSGKKTKGIFQNNNLNFNHIIHISFGFQMKYTFV
jgi:hypothetical protein